MVWIERGLFWIWGFGTRGVVWLGGVWEYGARKSFGGVWEYGARKSFGRGKGWEIVRSFGGVFSYGQALYEGKRGGFLSKPQPTLRVNTVGRYR